MNKYVQSVYDRIIAVPYDDCEWKKERIEYIGTAVEKCDSYKELIELRDFYIKLYCDYIGGYSDKKKYEEYESNILKVVDMRIEIRFENIMYKRILKNDIQFKQTTIHCLDELSRDIKKKIPNKDIVINELTRIAKRRIL